MFLFSPQVSSFWQCPGISRPGFRPGLRHSDRHRPGHRVPHVQSGEPLGSVDVDTSSRAGGARRCWAHQRSLHWWVWAVRVGTRTPSGLHPPTGIQTETTVIFISMIINVKILLSKVQWEGQTKTHYAFGHSTAAVHWVLLVLALSIWCFLLKVFKGVFLHLAGSLAVCSGSERAALRRKSRHRIQQRGNVSTLDRTIVGCRKALGNFSPFFTNTQWCRNMLEDQVTWEQLKLQQRETSHSAKLILSLVIV